MRGGPPKAHPVREGPPLVGIAAQKQGLHITRHAAPWPVARSEGRGRVVITVMFYITLTIASHSKASTPGLGRCCNACFSLRCVQNPSLNALSRSPPGAPHNQVAFLKPSPCIGHVSPPDAAKKQLRGGATRTRQQYGRITVSSTAHVPRALFAPVSRVVESTMNRA